MAAYDNAQLPQAPKASDYAPPQVNFAPFAQVADSYFKGTQQKRELGLQNAFKNGLPRDQQGNIDIGAMSDTVARLGGAQAAMPLIQQGISQQIGQGNAAAIMGGASPGAQPDVRPASAPAATGPSNVSRGATYTGGDNGQNTLMSIVSGQVPPEQAGMVANKVAQMLKLDPNQPLSQDQLPMVGRALMAAGIGRPTGPNGMAGPPGPQNGPPQPQGQAGQAGPGTQPQAAPQPPAGAPGLPPGYTLDAAQNRERAATALRARASATAKFDEPGAKLLEKQADALEAQAKQIREAVTAFSAPTPEQKQARDPAVLQRAAELESQKTKIAQSQKTYNGMQGSAALAQGMGHYIDLSKGILNDPKFYSGAGGDFSVAFNRWKTLAGGDPRAAVLQEALSKVTASSVLQQINQQRADLTEMGGTSGRIFAQQVDLVEKAAPAMANTIQGNRLLVETASRVGKLSQEVARQAQDYIGQHGYLDEKFDRQIAGYIDKNPMFTQQELKNIPLLGSAEFKTPQDFAAAAKSGAIHDGEWVRTPAGYKQFHRSSVPAPTQHIQM